MSLVNRAEGAHPVGGQVLELGARGDAVLRVALRGVIFIPADVANILFHIIVVFKVNISKFQSAKIRLFFIWAKKTVVLLIYWRGPIESSLEFQIKTR
jgi:hypothetical protein